MKKIYPYILAAVLSILIFVGAMALTEYLSNVLNPSKEVPELGTIILPSEGEVTLYINQEAVFPGVRIRPIDIVEESRCPSDVTCIQAGTVRVALLVVSGMGTSTNTMALGDEITTEAETITFVAADPDPISTSSISKEAYRLTFMVTKRSIEEIAPSLPAKKCYVGGCSAQLCTDEEGVASTCEYRESYACYQNATCEVQPSGECGWTETAELTSCLMSS